MIDKGNYSQKRAGLKADMIGKANRAIMTVEKVEEVEIPDNRTNEPRNALAITFREFRDNPYWPNGTSIGILCDVYGNDEDMWIGKKIPLEKVKANNPTTGKVVDSLWVMEAEKWAEAGVKVGVVAKKSTARKTVAAGGKKK